MKRIAVVNHFGTVPGEAGYSRTHSICTSLENGGYKVDLITSSFNHWSKTFKDQSLYTSNNLPYSTIVLSTIGYQKNVSINRLKSHRLFAKNLKKYLHNQKYDIVITVVPSLEAAMVSSDYCKRNNIPFVIDLNDLWPEAFRMIIRNSFLYTIITCPIRRMANKVYRSVDGVIGTSETYMERPFAVNKKNAKKITVYVGTDMDDFDEGATKNQDIKKNENEFWITYAGSLGTSYDIHTLMKAGGILAKKGYSNIKFFILGDGPLRSDFEQTSQICGCNSQFLGYTKYLQMAAYLKKSDILVNSFVKSAPQSIVNKVGDYLSAGKPMINTCSDLEMRRLVDKFKFGENIIAEDETKLANLIEKLYKNPGLCKEYSVNARLTAEKYFDRKTSYMEIVNLVNSLL